MDENQPYCETPAGRAPAVVPGGPPYADCVRCGKPTEYAVATPGIVLCPVCEWQEAQRSACSG
ncbi:hypothetical protein NLX86_23225 [Streptomyces sp. A3M-1-3]|uniref:hypothetical protein n=1 Tax=Streptomyces sp. A3M-1-3 TaxID=2962044 RepID=UPI0020B8FF86|nr:hypothetical protein [Streptomyces sp. A3M-1-3]MCP3820900.1 hypothetical protein [Streptomyces sp. A3M-1-3]